MKIKRTVEAFKSGQMDQDMMASGEMEWAMVWVGLFMPRVTSMRANGLKTRQMALGFTLTITEADTKVSGIKISNMVMVLNNGQTVPSMRDNMNKA
jgi:hypothetical protein